MKKIISLISSILLISCGSGDKNTPPTLGVIPALSTLEGNTNTIFRFQATDSDQDRLTYTLGGEDSSVFSLNGNNLSFVENPDYEAPIDANTDNIYELTVTVSDGKDRVDGNFTITVKDAIEGLVIDAPVSNSTVFIDKNSNLILDDGEANTKTDLYGKYYIEKSLVEQQQTLVAKGGLDTFSGETVDFLLASKIYLDDKDINISTFSTILKLSENYQNTLEKIIGDEFSNERDFLAYDFWAENSNLSNDLKRTNGQIINLLRLSNNISDINSNADFKLLSALSLELNNENDSLQNILASPNFSEIIISISSDFPSEIQNYYDIIVNTIQSPWQDMSIDIFKLPDAYSIPRTLNEYLRAYLSNELTEDELNEFIKADNIYSSIKSELSGIDTDLDGLIDPLDEDDDGDEYLDWNDVFPLDSTEWIDTDSDGVGNNADTDDDNDSFSDTVDAFPLDSTEWIDTDSDGVGNNADTDDDNDGFSDTVDVFPLDSTEWIDTDSDGVGNNADTDDDNDGVNDERDTDPIDPNVTPPTAKFEMLEFEAYSPVQVNFYDDNSIAGNNQNTIIQRTWFVDDVEVEQGDVLTYLFRKDKVYNVSLLVTNDENLSHKITKELEIQELTSTISVSGKILINNNMIVDSDVNDSKSENRDNNTISNAQIISKESIVSGYINEPFTGPNYNNEGLLYESGDAYDIYSIFASGNEQIKLLIADNSTDLDLELYDSTLALVDYSILPSGNDYENVIVPERSGQYFIVVYPYSGASKYTLTVEEQVEDSSVLTNSFSSRDDIINGEVILEYQDGYNKLPKKFKGLFKSNDKKTYGRFALFEFEESSSLELRGLDRNGVYKFNSNYDSLDYLSQKYATHLYIKRLKYYCEIKFSEPNYIQKKFTDEPNEPNEPNDEYYPLQWHYKNINLDNAWSLINSTDEVIVAVLDTGIANHPDLSLNLSAGGYDFVSDTAGSGDGDGYDSEPRDPGDGGDNPNCPEGADQTSSFHGTHVAGTIAAVGNNTIGVSGVTWNTKIMDVRVLGCLGGTTYDILQGLLYAAGFDNASGTTPTERADIINMSLGGGSYSEIYQSIINDITDSGVIIVAAAGNDGTSSLSYPASYDNVISVGSANLSGERVRYSQFNNKLDIVAPGGDTTNDLNGDGYVDGILSTSAKIEDSQIKYHYKFEQGTSMAAPHVSGVIALMEGLHDFNQSKIEEVIRSGAITSDLGELGKDDEFGFGKIDAYKSVLQARSLESGEPIPENPMPGLSTTVISLGNFSSIAQIELFNSGTGTLSILSVTTDDNNISVFPPENSNGLGVYTIELNRDELSEGIYSSTITFNSDSSTVPFVELSLTYSVRTNVENPNAGTVWVNLYDVYKEQSNWGYLNINENGYYEYTIQDVDPGVYMILAGTDTDNNGIIGQVSEAIGYYPSKIEPVLIIGNRDHTGIDFNINYNIPLLSPSNSESNSLGIKIIDSCITSKVNTDPKIKNKLVCIE